MNITGSFTAEWDSPALPDTWCNVQVVKCCSDSGSAHIAPVRVTARLGTEHEQNMKHAGRQQLRMVRVGAMRGKCRHVNRESGLSDFHMSLHIAAAAT